MLGTNGLMETVRGECFLFVFARTENVSNHLLQVLLVILFVLLKLLLSEHWNFIPVTTHHCFFLFAAPFFDLHSGRQCLFASCTFLLPRQFYGKSARGIAWIFTLMMFADSMVEIICMSCVIGGIGTTQNINPESNVVSPYPSIRRYAPISLDTAAPTRDER